MPKGVEHIGDGEFEGGTTAVKIPKKPKGVEHGKEAGATVRIGACEDSKDAERRWAVGYKL